MLKPVRAEIIEGQDEFGGRVKLRILRDVGYLIEAHFDLTDLASGDEKAGQHAARFKRAMSQQRYYRPPFLGLAQFPARITQIDSDDALPVTSALLSREMALGVLAHDVGSDGRARFFEAHLHDGILDVPPPGSPLLFA